MGHLGRLTFRRCGKSAGEPGIVADGCKKWEGEAPAEPRASGDARVLRAQGLMVNEQWKVQIATISCRPFSVRPKPITLQFSVSNNH